MFDTRSRAAPFRCLREGNMKMASRKNHLPLIWLFGALMLYRTGAAAAERGDDALLTTPATPEVIAKGLEADGYQLGLSAYSWGYPLVRMERALRSYSDVSTAVPAKSYRAAVDKIGWARELATPSAKDMPTANNDTFYMSAVVVVEPFVLVGA
jgi:hypothetical protein